MVMMLIMIGCLCVLICGIFLLSRWQESHHEVHRVCLHVSSILQNISAFGQHLERGGSSSPSICIQYLGLWWQIFWIIVRPLIEVINGEELFVLHPFTQLIKLIWPSQPQTCLGDVLKLLLEFLHGFEEGVLLGFTHWCFGNVGRGGHIEVVKGDCINILGSGLQKE